MMKISMALFCLLLVTGFSYAQYRPVESGSVIQFSIKNFGFNVTGSLTGIQGEIRFDPDSAALARFDVSVDASSVNTDNTMRDGHLKEDTYLDVKNHPRIRFVSESVRAARKKGEYEVSGKLTIKGKTKAISFPFTVQASGKGFLFAGSFKINRKDFEVGGSSTISDNLTVNLKIQAN